MSAREVIESIKALPLQDIQEVKAFVDSLNLGKAPEVMDREKAREISRRIMSENNELFQKLAQ